MSIYRWRCISICFLFLLICAPVGAEPIGMQAELRANGTLCRMGAGPWFPARHDGKCYSVDEQAAPCLAQMEAAMRAMEPFTMIEKFPALGSMESYREALKYEKVGKNKQRALEAFDLWQAAQKACWKEPK